MTIDKKNIGDYLGVIGTFNDWSGDEPLVYNSLESAWLTEPITFAEAGAFKIRANGDWTLNWGTEGTMSTAVNGGFEVVAAAGDVPVTEAGTYIVKLHANRTPFVIELIKQ